jgi:uncharacterized protein YdcH (DUF465 family)
MRPSFVSGALVFEGTKLIELNKPRRKIMSHVAHELHEEFPDNVSLIQMLKSGNAHFAKLTEDYHELNRSIHRMETDVEPTDDTTLESLKKKRLSLKDEIAHILTNAK